MIKIRNDCMMLEQQEISGIMRDTVEKPKRLAGLV
jgi:hypothetical protein